MGEGARAVGARVWQEAGRATGGQGRSLVEANGAKSGRGGAKKGEKARADGARGQVRQEQMEAGAGQGAEDRNWVQQGRVGEASEKQGQE